MVNWIHRCKNLVSFELTLFLCLLCLAPLFKSVLSNWSQHSFCGLLVGRYIIGNWRQRSRLVSAEHRGFVAHYCAFAFFPLGLVDPFLQHYMLEQRIFIYHLALIMLSGWPSLWLRKSHWRQRTLELLTLLRDLSKARRCCVKHIRMASLCFQLTCLWQIEYRHLLAFIFVELILKRQTRFVHELTVLMHDLYQVGVLICKLCILVPDSISKEFLLSSVWPAILHH